VVRHQQQLDWAQAGLHQGLLLRGLDVTRQQSRHVERQHALAFERVRHLACHDGGLFAGYAPVSGTFWAPVPAACPTGPVTILHTHGTNDPVVPLAGRPIGTGRQGDVAEALRRYAAFGGFGPPVETDASALACTRRSNPQGRILELCLHPGSHELRAEDLARAAGTSRSVLAERFQQLVGQPPMQYLAQWRMLLATNLLVRSNAPLARIAEEVGYQTDTAFSRAFRREYGMPPAAWRRNHTVHAAATDA
jgi:AraC-like DNA-binding protein